VGRALRSRSSSVQGTGRNRWLRKAAKPIQAQQADVPEVRTGDTLTFSCAGCATDDPHGWVEQTSGTITRHAGVFDGFGLSRDECGAISMKAAPGSAG